MKILKISLFVSLITSAIIVQTASAAVLYQSVSDLTQAVPHSALCSSCNGNYQVYDTFSISEKSTVDGISVSLSNWYSSPSSLDVDIYSVKSDGTPGTILWNQTFSQNQFTSIVNGKGGYGLNVSSAIYTVDPTGLNLSAGTYDISFYNSNNLGVEEFPIVGGKLYQFTQGSIIGPVGYFIGDYSAGFTLDGSNVSAVPLPGGGILFGSVTVLSALFGARSKRRKNLN
jgi:hypothetical protein